MRQQFQWLVGGVVASVALVLGCSEAKDPSKKETIPIKGEVVVDGAPAAGVLVQLFTAQDISTRTGSLSIGSTDDQGKFEIGTYSQGDGAPPGDYSVTFSWPAMQMSQEREAPDRLKNRYKDPSKSTFKITVASDKPVDMGKVELTTK